MIYLLVEEENNQRERSGRKALNGRRHLHSLTSEITYCVANS